LEEPEKVFISACYLKEDGVTVLFDNAGAGRDKGIVKKVEKHLLRSCTVKLARSLRSNVIILVLHANLFQL
jgi:hypothetical protein